MSPHEMSPDPAMWGIQKGYEDARGEWRETSEETAERLLKAMNAQGAPPSARCVFSSPDRQPDLSGATSLITEDGRRMDVGSGIPRDLPWGYHRLHYADGPPRTLIHSPGRCYLPDHLRVWGWGVQLPSLWSELSWGLGDLGDLVSFGRAARERGAEVALLNPLHAQTPGPQHPSPYFPSTRCLRDPIYLRVEDVPGAGSSGIDLEALAAVARASAVDDRVDRDRVYGVKMKALRALYESRSEDPRFDEFVARRDASFDDLCTYMAIADTHGGSHRTWDASFAHPGSPSVSRWRTDHRDDVRFQMWLQWLLDLQLRDASRGIGLIHDVAIGVDPWGADAWLWQHVFADDVTVGAPPDVFSPTGQDWGLPPFDPWKLQAAAYEPFIALIRASLTHAAGARIDHVMGLFRLWWIPTGAPATEGAYVTYPSDDLWDIVALESHRAHAFVVGEDLGTVEPSVRAEMERRGVLSYKLALFEDQPPESYPELALAAVTNHDLPTLAGLWDGTDLAEVKGLGLETDDGAWDEMRAKIAKLSGDGDPIEAVTLAAHEALARAPSRVLIATLEDALHVRERVNVPGTSDDQRANWSHRLPLPVGQLASAAEPLSRAMERAPLVAQRDVNLPSVRLNVAEAGEGPLAIFLHGFPDFWRSWRFQLPAVARAGFHAIAPDMRGYNLSDKPESVGSYAIEELCDDVRHLIESYGAKRASIVGHDWGAIVAWFFAMNYPDLVERLVVMNVPHPSRYASGATNPRQWLRSWYISFFQLPWLPEAALRYDDYRSLREVLRRGSPGFSHEVIEEYVEAARRSNGMHFPVNYYRSFFRRNVIGTLRDLNVIEHPTLVVWGDRDPVIEPGLAVPDHRWVPNLRLERLPLAGHWPHLDEPDVVNRLLIEHLASP